LKGLDRKQVAYKLVESKTLPCMWRRRKQTDIWWMLEMTSLHIYTRCIS